MKIAIVFSPLQNKDKGLFNIRLDFDVLWKFRYMFYKFILFVYHSHKVHEEVKTRISALSRSMNL